MKDAEQLCAQLTKFVAETALETFRRRCAVVGVSGGIDSAVTAALSARALGSENVTGVSLLERDNSAITGDLARELCERLGIKFVQENITAALDALGCYALRDAAVAELVPGYDPQRDVVAVRLVQDLRMSKMPAMYEVIVSKPSGEVLTRRPTSHSYRTLFAASNYKQRIRTVKLFHHAEMRDACVVGTSNLDEEYLGFFVKLGDGSWDIGPLDELTKTSVRELAEVLDIPDAITLRPTTTDTFPVAEQSQEDMFYSLPFESLDILLEVLVGRRSHSSAVSTLGWPASDVDYALHNLERRHNSTQWNRTQGVRPGRDDTALDPL